MFLRFSLYTHIKTILFLKAGCGQRRSNFFFFKSFNRKSNLSLISKSSTYINYNENILEGGYNRIWKI